MGADDELPEGWVATTLGEVAPASNEKVEPYDRPKSPYLSLEHVESNTLKIIGRGLATDVRSTKSVFRAGDIVYGKLRPYLNKVAIPTFDGICSTDFIVFPQRPWLSSTYLMWFLSQPHIVEYANHHSTGVSLPRVKLGALAQIELPLPPLAEQQRIVAKVEELLAQVNAARQRLARTTALLKRFRQSVLSAACDGRLTADWRGDSSSNGDLPEGWRRGRFDEVTKNFDGRRVPIRESDRAKRRGPYPYYGASGAIDTIDDYLFDGEFLLIGEDGANLLMRSKPIAFRVSGKFWVNNHAHVVQAADGNEQAYLEAFFNSIDIQEYVTGSAQPKLTQASLNGILVPTPPSAEQEEIVRRVDALFALADTIESRVAAAAARAERLTQSILAKAFRGELVPTEAELARREGRDYEPASVLLDRLEAERAAEPSPSRPRPPRRPRRPVRKTARRS